MRETDLERLGELEHSGKVVVTRHNDDHLRLANPTTRQAVQFYPARGTIVRANVRQVRRGLDAALKLIGVKVAA